MSNNKILFVPGYFKDIKRVEHKRTPIYGAPDAETEFTETVKVVFKSKTLGLFEKSESFEFDDKAAAEKLIDHLQREMNGSDVIKELLGRDIK